jgi:hypothetical protein
MFGNFKNIHIFLKSLKFQNLFVFPKMFEFEK